MVELAINKHIFLLERRYYKLFHVLRDLQMSGTEFTKEYFYLLVYFGNFWNILKKAGEFEFGIEVEFELNLN